MLTLDRVEAASRRLVNRVHRTPVVTCRSFDDATGQSVFFKCENQQRAGSFKIRGALNRLLTLGPEERARGVVAFSSGNHAQGVALAARMVGTSAVICMPTDAPALKLAATRDYGAQVVLYDRQRDDREAIARRISAESQRLLVPPYDDYEVMAGQGTAALELLQDVPSLDALVTPVGGGGLMAGCCVATKSLFPTIEVFGVEPDTANDTFLSFQKGERTRIPPPPTLADGVRNLIPGELTFPILRAHVSDILLVSDDDIVKTARFLLFRAKLLVEPTGAVAAAAVFTGRLPLARGARVGVVLSGGNVDPSLLAGIIQAD